MVSGILMIMRGPAIASVVLLGCLAGCSAAKAEPIPMPPAGAQPEVVLGAYLKALKAGDCATASRLAGPTFTPSNGDLCGRLKVASYTDPGSPSRPTDGEAIFSTTLSVSGADASMHDGENTWFYDLEQVDGEWRLVGGGSGP